MIKNTHTPTLADDLDAVNFKQPYLEVAHALEIVEDKIL